jgi:hypothetical protein
VNGWKDDWTGGRTAVGQTGGSMDGRAYGRAGGRKADGGPGWWRDGHVNGGVELLGVWMEGGSRDGW